ncbi:hypothetical protein N431DRAFT_451613 [Stipitochalara longipes BDJ]|nr:hypothetical protein N431DRAFT_451613 [Stipitochalara longipes BDJ]
MDKRQHSGWSQPIRLSRTDAQQRASAGCAWWTFIYKQIRRHELLCKAKLKWKADTDIRKQDKPDEDDDSELHGLESFSLDSYEAELLEKYLDRIEFKELLSLTEAENLFDASRPSSPLDSLDDDPNSVWVKYRFVGRTSDDLQHLHLTANMTLTSDGNIDGMKIGRRSFESNFLVLAVPHDLDKSTSIAWPINVNPGSSDSFNLIRHWIRRCETSHSCCFTKAPDNMPSMLLDVQSLASEDRVKIVKVSATMKERYISLSYCWGVKAQSQG